MLALGDVSGKGTGAALLMTVLRAAVRGLWGEASVSDAVSRINSTVCQNVTAGKYITYFMARLDPATGGVDYVNAGHNPPLLVRKNGEIETLRDGGMVLGLFDSIPYEEGTAELRSGDTLLIFSDGVTETWSAKGEEFGDDRLGQVALRGRGLDAAGLQTEILKELEVFEAGTKATDDRTLIVVKRY
jgi:serine phosphatase RsbU (regulator of sigma subunit)